MAVIPDEFPDSMTLGEARAWLRGEVEEGARCPLCTQFAKIYKRPIHATMARDLIALWRRFGVDEWFHLADHVGHPGDFAKLRYWGLIEEADAPREDGGRGGMWRVTSEGVAFVQDARSVPKHARVYDSRCLGLTGEPVGVRDALADRFDYRELMSA